MKEQCFFLSLAFILNLLDSLLFMEEVVEHLVMETAPPCCNPAWVVSASEGDGLDNWVRHGMLRYAM